MSELQILKYQKKYKWQLSYKGKHVEECIVRMVQLQAVEYSF